MTEETKFEEIVSLSLTGLEFLPDYETAQIVEAPPYTEEELLWLSVIWMAVEDSRGDGAKARQARSVILSQHPVTADWFQSICEFARLDPQAIRDIVRKDGNRT